MDFPAETGNNRGSRSTGQDWRPALGLVLCVLGLIIIAFSAFIVWTKQNGGLPPDVPQAAVNPLGVNVSLEQYDEAELERGWRQEHDCE